MSCHRRYTATPPPRHTTHRDFPILPRSCKRYQLMVRTKITYRTMGITSSPNQGYHLMRATSYDALSSSLDLNNRYSCASSQASTQDAFEENNFYRLDFTCPYCTNPSYITGEHFGDNRYIVTYDFEQAVEYTTEYVSSMEGWQCIFCDKTFGFLYPTPDVITSYPGFYWTLCLTSCLRV